MYLGTLLGGLQRYKYKTGRSGVDCISEAQVAGIMRAWLGQARCLRHSSAFISCQLGKNEVSVRVAGLVPCKAHLHWHSLCIVGSLSYRPNRHGGQQTAPASRRAATCALPAQAATWCFVAATVYTVPFIAAVRSCSIALCRYSCLTPCLAQKSVKNLNLLQFCSAVCVC